MPAVAAVSGGLLFAACFPFAAIGADRDEWVAGAVLGLFAGTVLMLVAQIHFMRRTKGPVGLLASYLAVGSILLMLLLSFFALLFFIGLAIGSTLWGIVIFRRVEGYRPAGALMASSAPVFGALGLVADKVFMREDLLLWLGAAYGSSLGVVWALMGYLALKKGDSGQS